MAREVKETSKVLSGKSSSIPFITAVSTVVPLVVHKGVEAMRAALAVMKSSLISTAERWMFLWSVMAGFARQAVVRTAGPQALSRIRSGDVGGGRDGLMRDMRWLARTTLQPPVRAL